MMGRIHSIETFGAVDGPGVRFVRIPWWAHPEKRI